MITLFTIPKAFDDAFGTLQRDAVRSWLAALPGVQVILVGDDRGVAEAAAALRVSHLPQVARSDTGTPLLNDAFARVEREARHPLRCFVNADILLPPAFARAATLLAALGEPVLAVGETVDLDVRRPLAFDEGAWGALAADAERRGVRRGATAIDYFLFTPGLFDPIPPFAVGRARFDNWLVWRARSRGRVVDLTPLVRPVHQRHDYRHLRGGFREAHFGAEAERNERLAGGGGRAYTIHDASHRMRSDGSLAWNPGSVLRVRERARKAAWKLGRRRTLQ